MRLKNVSLNDETHNLLRRMACDDRTSMMEVARKAIEREAKERKEREKKRDR